VKVFYTVIAYKTARLDSVGDIEVNICDDVQTAAEYVRIELEYFGYCKYAKRQEEELSKWLESDHAFELAFDVDGATVKIGMEEVE